MPAHGTGEYDTLQVATLLDEVLDLIAMDAMAPNPAPLVLARAARAWMRPRSASMRRV